MQLTGKISLKLDSNSSLLLEYGCNSLNDMQINTTSRVLYQKPIN